MHLIITTIKDARRKKIFQFYQKNLKLFLCKGNPTDLPEYFKIRHPREFTMK